MRRWIGSALVVMGLTWSAAAIPPGNIGGAADAGKHLPEPSTRPLTADELAAVYGPSTDEDAQNVKKLVDQWIKAPAQDRDAGEIALQELVKPRTFALLEAQAQRADLSDDARQWLNAVLQREIPRQHARLILESRINAYNEWNGRTVVEAYEKAGHKGAKWDETALAGIREFTKPRADHRKAFALLNKAIEQSCDDPLVMYMDGREMGTYGDIDRADQRLQAAAEAIAKSNYPASRKELAILYAFEHYYALWMGRYRSGQALPADFKERLNPMTKAYMDAFPPMAAEPGVSDRVLQQVATRILSVEVWPEMDRKRMFDWVYPPLEKALPQSAVPLIVKGNFYILYAWDARGGGYANTVTPDGWKHFRERLAEAHQAFEQAWSIDPTRPEIGENMITVCMGEQLPRPKMEKWFSRAMAADPDDQQACSNKLTYLEPKWSGSAQSMLEFGHECLTQGNWHGRIAFELIDVHRRLATYAADPNVYWTSPQVWEDSQAMWIPWLKAKPDDDHSRSSYCFWACRTQHWDEALKQFDILGDKADAKSFNGKDAMEKMRAEAKEKGSR